MVSSGRLFRCQAFARAWYRPVPLLLLLVVARCGGVLSLDSIDGEPTLGTTVETYRRIAGSRAEFVDVPPPRASGTHELVWRFAGSDTVEDVHVVQGCCPCPDSIVASTGPDPSGLFRCAVRIDPTVTSWLQVSYTIAGITFRSSAVYFNVPTGDAGAAAPPVLWYHGRWVSRESLRDALSAGVITHVLIDGADRGYAATAPEILEAISVSREAGVSVVWCRQLWNTESNLQTLEDVFDPEFYAAAIAQVISEAGALGADATAMDCEVYAPTVVDDFLARDLSDADELAMRNAISTAAARGRLDFVYPAGWHGRPRAPERLYAMLARHPVSESTYYDYPAKNCRITYPYEVFGAYAAGWTERPDDGLVPHFLADDIVARRYLWSAADGAPPGVNGLFLYAGPDQTHVTAAARWLRDAFATPP